MNIAELFLEVKAGILDKDATADEREQSLLRALIAAENIGAQDTFAKVEKIMAKSDYLQEICG